MRKSTEKLPIANDLVAKFSMAEIERKIASFLFREQLEGLRLISDSNMDVETKRRLMRMNFENYNEQRRRFKVI